MSFDNKDDFKPILNTAKELLKAQGYTNIVEILNRGELSVLQTGYDNWNGGIYFYSLYVNIDVPDFVKLQPGDISAVENQILGVIRSVSRGIDNEDISQVIIAPRVSSKINWDILSGITKGELKTLIESLRNKLISVATGGNRIQDIEKEYDKIYSQVSIALKSLDIDNPNPYKNLWDWYGKWRADFPTYQERRVYVREIYDSLLALFEESDESKIVDIKVDLSDWEKIKRNIVEVKNRESQASVEEQFQVVGMLCREVIISLAQAVFIPDRHPSTDGVEISKTDAKRMLEAYLAVNLAGQEYEELRAYAKTTNKLANTLTHKRTATKREMLLCTSATLALINFIGIIEDKF